MTQPIYKLFLFRNTEAYYQLSEDERNEALAKLDAAFQKVGGKRLIMCDSSWSSEQWPVFGVEEFPNIEAVQQYAEALNELNLARYVESMTVLGTELQSTQPEISELLADQLARTQTLPFGGKSHKNWSVVISGGFPINSRCQGKQSVDRVQILRSLKRKTQ